MSLEAEECVGPQNCSYRYFTQCTSLGLNSGQTDWDTWRGHSPACLEALQCAPGSQPSWCWTLDDVAVFVLLLLLHLTPHTYSISNPNNTHWFTKSDSVCSFLSVLSRCCSHLFGLLSHDRYLQDSFSCPWIKKKYMNLSSFKLYVVCY